MYKLLCYGLTSVSQISSKLLWLAVHYIYFHTPYLGKVRAIHDSSGKGQLEDLDLELSYTLHHAPRFHALLISIIFFFYFTLSL